MSLSSGDSRMANLHLQGVELEPPAEEFGPAFMDRLIRWQARDDHSDPAAALLKDPSVAWLVIDRKGEVREYWPDARANDLSESLLREFAEEDRVWERVGEEPLCARLRYTVFSEEEELVQLLCPFLDEENNQVAGLVVVCRQPA